MPSKNGSPAPEPVAIIGIGCRFPGAEGVDAYWRLLSDGIDAISEVPPDRWSLDEHYDPDPSKPSKVITRWGGFVDGVLDLDAQFFRMTPREAARLDPQQRLALEAAWQAVEDAGIAPEHLAGSNVGVFMGGFALESFVHQLDRRNRHLIDTHTATGSMMTMVANRISYFFDVHGPSVAVDTACSSSLVAVHLACQSLWSGESSMALAGGVNVMLSPEFTMAESKGGFLSPDGRCKTFDAAANGYVRGEGAGVVALKPLGAAVAAHDPIYAVIRGTGVNQDGHTSGITVPSGEAQAALLREVYARAGVQWHEVQYIEAHGTGTALGDPIEVGALASVLGHGRAEGEPLIIGSTKTNIGHLEAAAGVAGLIKAALCLRYGAIPPNLHFETPNPRIAFDELRVRVPTRLEAWPAHTGPRIAGVNSFGFGGTNAHVVLSEPPTPTCHQTPSDSDTPVARPHVLPLSARGTDALRARAASISEYLRRDPHTLPSLERICATIATRRGQHEYRLAVSGTTHAEVAEQLSAFVAGESRSGLASTHLQPGQSPGLVFVCSGMGPQWWAMGRLLFEREPVFRAAIERCDAALRERSGWSLIEELGQDEERSRMAETAVAQPANFALQIGLAELWKARGVRPTAVVGHSAGEAAAAYIAGALTFEDAIKVTYHRSRLQQLTSGQGRMLAVSLPLEEAKAAIDGLTERVSIAAVNSASAVTLVGDVQALEGLKAELETRGTYCKLLYGGIPYHSHYMEAIREQVFATLADVQPRTTDVPLYSTVTGRLVDGRELDAGYWWRNVRQPVYFEAAVRELIQAGHTVFLELAPHPVLASSITECLAAQRIHGVVTFSLRRKEDDLVNIARATGALYAANVPVDWSSLYPAGDEPVALPIYPWQRERHWTEATDAESDRLGYQDHPLLGRRVNGPRATWQLQLNRRRLPYLSDHKVQSAVLFPGAGYVEMCLAAAARALGAGDYDVENIAFRKGLFLSEAEDPTIQTLVDVATGAVEVCSQSTRGSQAWNTHATATVHPRHHVIPGHLAVDQLRQTCSEELDHSACYALFAKLGFEYGQAFQGVQRLWRTGDDVLGEILATEAPGVEYRLHPTLLDACFQLLVAGLPAEAESAEGGFLPVGIDRVRVLGTPGGRVWAHARIRQRGPLAIVGDIVVADEAGTVIAEVSGFRVQPTHTASAAPRAGTGLYTLSWQPDECPLADSRPGRWLILGDRTGAADDLRAMLEQQGNQCSVVRPDRIDANSPDAYRGLLRSALAAHADWRGIVYLSGLDASFGEGATPADIEAAQRLTCHQPLALVQTLAEIGGRVPPRVWLVTRGVQSTDGRSSPALAQAPMWGLGQVIAREHAECWGGLVDLDPAPAAGEATQLVQALRSTTGDLVSLRGGMRLTARLGRFDDPSLVAAPLRSDGSYLITGGLGGLGLVVARWLVDHGARRLILMGRTQLPDRAAWSSFTPEAPHADEVAAIRALERLGASVHLATADVANLAQLEASLRDYRAGGWPPIVGVVHAAGIVDDQLLLNMQPTAFETVMRPKVQGAWNLHRLLADEPLDFFVLFSSVASLLGTLGQGNYAAGNAFMDALAHYRRALGRPGLSINWGPWAEVGMAARLGVGHLHEQQGMHTLAPAQALQEMGRLLQHRSPAQVGVLAMNWPRWCQTTAGAEPASLLAGLCAAETTDNAFDEASGHEAGAEAEAFQTLVLMAEPHQRTELVTARLRDVVAAVVGLDASQLELHLPLTMLGIDSLMAMELKTHVEHSLGMQLSLIDLLKGSSAAELAAELAERMVPDDQELERVLAEVELLTPDEVPQLLV